MAFNICQKQLIGIRFLATHCVEAERICFRIFGQCAVYFTGRCGQFAISFSLVDKTA